MAEIEGRWVAIARQAIFLETPMQYIRPGSIADLVIEPNGNGHSYKKGLFSQKELPLTWTHLSEQYYRIDFERGVWLFCGYDPEEDLLMTGWTSSIRSVDGMGVFYKRA